LNSTGTRAKVSQMRARLALACAFLVCAAGACTLFNPLGYLGPGDGGDDVVAADGGRQDAPQDHRANDLGIVDSQDGSTDTKGSTGDCPDGTVGPKGMFCIDEQEVTNAPYQAFWEKTDGGVIDPPPPECAWKKTVHPSMTSSSGANFPVGGVDWCDALLYCTSVNERLCGAVADGGPVPPTARVEFGVDEWAYACSKAGAFTYPYGATYDAMACNGLEYEAGGPLGELKAGKACIGGFSDLLNMSGNVAEWENSCSDAGSLEEDMCAVRGGSYLSLASDLKCVTPDDYRRSTSTRKDIGFRCCADRTK
jgi:sulfatase modifying factor 1